MFSTPDDWIVFVVVGVVGLALWALSRPKYPISITVGPKGVTAHRGIPQARQASLLTFFEEEIDVEGRVVVQAARTSTGQLRTRFSGPIDPGQRQRIRNVLLAEL